MLESELLATKEHSRSLIDKLTVIEDRLDEKNQLVLELQELLRQQEEMNSKLQQLTGEKDCAIDEHVRAFTDLSESIQKYEEQIKILLTDKETLERRYQEEVISCRARFSVDSARSRVDTGCGGGRVSPLTDTECQFRPEAEVLHPSPWSLRLELAPDLLLAGDSSPLCDKGPLGRQCLLEMEGDKEARLHSANMLTGLMTLTAGVKTALLEYRHQLEATRNQLQPHNDSEQVFMDELTLSYAARLDEAASLLATSIEQASRCQTRFNCTFDLLMNKIATLQSEKEVAQLRNERLIAQLSEAASGHKDGLGSDTGERMKDEFLTDQLRRERLEVIRLRRDMETLHRAQKECLQYAQCSHCGQSCLQPTPAMMHQFSQDIDALDLAGGKQSPVRYEESGPGRRAQIPTTVDVDVERQDEEDEDADDIGVELNERPQYELPADELAQIRPRYRLSHVGGDSGGSGGGGEECMWSLLEPPLAERRASVFAHSLDEPDERVDSNNESAEKRAAAGATREQWVVQGGSSSRSSTATTSEDDEVVGTSASDQVGEQKRRLHKDLLETRLGQSRSSSTSLLGCSLHSEDLRATPTTTNLAVAAASPQSTTGAADIEMFPSSRSEAEPPGQSDLLQSRSRVSLLPLPSIAVIEPSIDQVSDHRCEDKVQQDRRDSVASTIVPPSFEPPSHSSDSPTTSCKQTSRTPSPNPESGSGRTKAREQRHRGTAGAGGRSRRPNTVTGVTVSSSTGSGSPAGLGLQPETSSGGCGSGSCDEVDRATSSLIRAPLPLAAAATVTLADDSDMADIQETMDLLRDISSSLDQLSSTDLKVRFVEVSLQYRTDRPSAPQRAIDAHYRCAKALANVSQEFGILRHLVKSVSLTMECPNELLSRIKASINVLERCVEYLSAKSEILGAVEEELKMCCIADIMQEYNARLGREKEEFQRKLEEARSCRDSNAEPRELAMPRKAPVVGKEAKARFQRAVQNTTLKTSVVRQLGLHSAQKPVLQQHLSLGSSSGAGGSPLSVDCGINQRRGLGSDFGVESGYRISTSTTRFFPDGPLTSEDTSDVMYLKGYNLGFKNARDQALIEVRTRQSEFAQRLENFNDLLEETDQESSTERDKSEETGSEPGQLQKGRMAALIGQAWSRLSLWRPWSSWSFDLGRSCEHLHTYLGRFLYVIMGTVVMLALLLPWLMTPSGDDGADQQDMAETSFSLPIRRRSSTPRLATPQPRVSPTTPPSSVSPASSLFSSLNVVRSGPTTT